MSNVSRRYIEKCVRYYKTLLGIEHAVTIKWSGASDDSYAEVQTAPEYHKHEIAVNLDKVTSRKDARLVAIHELCHVLLAPYTETARNVRVKGVRKLLNFAEEAIVTQMEKMPIWKGFKP